MAGFSISEIVVILVLALIIFGPNKLPDLAKTLGRTVKEFKKSLEWNEDEKPEGAKGERTS